MWSDNEERLYQRERLRRRVVNRIMLAGLAVFIVGIILHRHGPVVLLCTLAFMVALVASAILQTRWGIGGSVADSRTVIRGRRADRAHRQARRAQAIQDGTWTPPSGTQ
jgi:hypothetical protein